MRLEETFFHWIDLRVNGVRPDKGEVMKKLIGISCFVPYYILMIVLLFVLSQKLTITEIFIGVSFLITLIISTILMMKGMIMLRRK